MPEMNDSVPEMQDEAKSRVFRPPIDPRAIAQIPQLRRYLAVLSVGNFLIAIVHIAKSLSLAALIVEVIVVRQVRFTHIVFLLLLTLGLFALLTVFNGIFTAYGEHQPDKFGAELALDHAFQRLVHLPEQMFIQYMSRFQAGMAMQTESIRPYLTDFIPALVSTFVLVPILIIAITYIDWLSGIIIIVLLPAIPIFMVLIGKLTAEKSAEKVVRMEDLTRSVADTYAGISTMQALGRPQAADKFLTQVSARYAEISQRISSIIFLSSAILEFIATFSVAIVAVNIGMRLIYAKISLDAAIFVFVIIAEVYIPLRKVGSTYHASEDGRIYIENMLSIPQASTTFSRLSTDIRDNTLAGREDIPARDLTQPLLHIAPFQVVWDDYTSLTFEIDFTIYAGNIVVLRGDNGGGKTTLLRAILGTLTVAPPLSPMCNMVYLPVNSLIISGTIEENYRALTPELSFAELCAPLAGLGLSSLVEQYNFAANIAELSLGQRQFLLVCRALCFAAIQVQRESILVLLDEPLQFLDRSHTEIVERACASLVSRGASVIIASHDPESFLAFPSLEIRANSSSDEYYPAVVEREGCHEVQ